MEIIRDLGNRYGDLGSALVQVDGKLFVVSGTTASGHDEWAAFPANAHGGVTRWRDLVSRDTREEVLEALVDKVLSAELCHCGADFQGSDHCPRCGCEQFEADCGERPGSIEALRAQLEG